MAQTLLRKRPHQVVRPITQEVYEEPQTRQRLNYEGASSIKFKSTKGEVERVQSLFDNICDLLNKLEELDRASAGGVSHEDHI